MFLKLLELFSRYYYSIQNRISNCLFVETEIININKKSIGAIYYYYLLNYYSNFYFEYFLNNYFNYFTNFYTQNYYEVSYRRNNMICSTIINGNFVDIFNYTRNNILTDNLITILKSNLIINNIKTNIRQILRKYDTNTKLFDILLFNFYDDVILSNNQISLEFGKNTYEIRNMDKTLSLCNA